MATQQLTQLDPRSKWAAPFDQKLRVHTSDRGAFKSCRRKWHWTSPLRNNLRPLISHAGITWPLAFGTMIHSGLEDRYTPGTPRLSAVAGFLREFDTFERRVGEEAPEVLQNESEEFLIHRELGVGMMTHYEQWSEKNDNFTVIAAEQEFEIPIGTYEYGKFHPFQDATPFTEETPDKRIVYYCGRMDAVIQDNETKEYGIIDHKTASAMTDDYFKKLELDEQVSSYIVAAELKALYEDLPYREISFVYYNVLRKACVREPSVVYLGKPSERLSISRADESTTYDLFMAAVAKRGLSTWLANDEKAQAYANYLQREGDSQFFVRARVARNRNEVASMYQQIMDETADMLESPRIYPHPTGAPSCVRCAFRAPCIAVNDGSDYQFMLQEGYTKNMVNGRYTL